MSYQISLLSSAAGDGMFITCIFSLVSARLLCDCFAPRDRLFVLCSQKAEVEKNYTRLRRRRDTGGRWGGNHMTALGRACYNTRSAKMPRYGNGLAFGASSSVLLYVTIAGEPRPPPPIISPVRSTYQLSSPDKNRLTKYMTEYIHLDLSMIPGTIEF